MDIKTKQAIDAMEKIKSSDDIIYESFKSKKRAGWLHLWDIIADLIFDILPT